MKKISLIILLTTLVVFNIFALIRNNKMKHEIKSFHLRFQNQHKKFQKDSKDVISIINESFSKVMISEDKVLQNFKLISDTQEIVFLNDLISEKDKLIYYFRNKGCDICFDKEIENIKINSHILGAENILIISDFKNVGEQVYYSKECGVKTFDINDYKLNLAIEDYDEPFYFIIDKNLKIRDCYRPTQLFPDLSRIYFNQLKNKL